MRAVRPPATRRARTSAAARAAALVAWVVITSLLGVLTVDARPLAAQVPATRPPAPAPFGMPTNVAPDVGAPERPLPMPTALGAGALAAALRGLGTTARVLMIAAHPDDEDTNLIAWLARGRHVETAYLSLTRGDGGQNLIGDELGDNLGTIRTQELFAARRLDGGRQYFTRAFDFGFSKNADETFTVWPRDSVLADIVRVVRAFRPHVIVSVWSGTPRDGHGHHQASGLLAREAYDRAADTLRFPVHTHGLAWAPAKFYRASRFAANEMTWRTNVGEFDPIAGRSYAEVAAESRSQHRSQGFGSLQRRGALWDYLRREDTRVAAPADARDEVGLFDGLDTSWTALAARAPTAASRALLDSVMAHIGEARTLVRANEPEVIVAPLAQALRQVRAARDALGTRPPLLFAARPGFTAALVAAAGTQLLERATDGEGRSVDVPAPIGVHADPALRDALVLTEERLARALVLAAGVAVEATAERVLLPAAETRKRDVPDTLGVRVAVFNRGRETVTVHDAGINERVSLGGEVRVAPDSSVSFSRVARVNLITMPWWRINGREGGYFRAPIDARDDVERQAQLEPAAIVRVHIGGAPVDLRVPVVRRVADPVRGDVREAVAVVPGITIGLDRAVEYIRADATVDRLVPVRLLSAYPSAQPVTVRLEVPEGLVVDSASRERTLQPDVPLTVTFRVRGRLPAGFHELRAIAMHRGVQAWAGYYTIRYDHIPPQRSYGASTLYLSAVPATVRAGVRVGYVAGVSDDGFAALRALDVPVELLPASSVATADLSRFTTIVLGPRAYQVSDALRAANPRLFAWMQAGGTLVVQYGQFEMAEPGLMPFPVQFTRPAARVTREDAPVTVLDPGASLLARPNRVEASDWQGWVQERALYMPSVIDPRYRTFLEMQDPDEPPNRGALLAAPVGRGLYVYSSLALFRQFPYGVPGAARLLVNLVSARGSDLGAR